MLPSAVTISAEIRFSTVWPQRRSNHPEPPPSASPPRPVVETRPPVTARPWAWVAASSSPQVSPASARQVRVPGSTSMPFMGRRSIVTPSSQTAFPVTLWPPPYTDTRMAVVAGEADGRRHVSGVRAARDERRAAVDHRVEDPAELVVARVGAAHDLALEPRRGQPVLRGLAEREAQRAQEGVRLLDRGIVGAVLDDVQRPAVAEARRLRDLEPRREIVPAPDQRGRDADPRRVVQRCREVGHQAAERAHGARRSRLLDVGGLERLPPLAHRLAHAVEVERAPAPQSLVRLLAGVCEEALERGAEGGGGLEGGQPERVHEHQAAEPVAVAGREAQRDRAAERVADEHRGRRAGALDQLAEPRADPLGVQLAGGVDDRGAVAGQVGDDHAARRREARDDAQPVRRVPRRAVQQHHRRAVAALEDGGRDARQREPALRDGQPGEQVPPGILPDSRVIDRRMRRHLAAPICARRATRATLRTAAPRRHRRESPTCAAGRVVNIHHAGVRGGRARTRTRSPRCATGHRAWRRCSAGAGRRCAR